MAPKLERKVSHGERKIRVLHLIDSLELGGAQTALFAWLKEHDRLRFDVDIASIHGTSESLFYSRAKELDIAVIPLSPWRWLPLYVFRLPLRLIARRYDIVHCHLFASNWLGKPLARLFGVPVVVSEDQCNDAFRTRSPFVSWIDRFANRFCDQVFAVSRSIRDYLVEHERVPAKKIRVIPNGLPEVPPRPGRKFFRKRVGGAGRLVAQKNFERFLRIANVLQASDPSYEFKIAGSGPMEKALRSLAGELGVNVEWLGPQPTLDRFFTEIDLFLLTSDFEGLPMTVLEALQAGVPTAAMAVDGIKEEFVDEVALLDPASSDREIGQQIVALMADQEALSAQTERGIALISTRFSARKQIREIEHVYVDLLARKRRGRLTW
jgi:glycosyltransferase involved in cell wall biosynthesis